jgi:hypothetical protein
VPSLEYIDFINFDFPFVEESHDEGIYNCSAENSAMTMVSGAKCSDDIVLIADRKLTK